MPWRQIEPNHRREFHVGVTGSFCSILTTVCLQCYFCQRTNEGVSLPKCAQTQEKQLEAISSFAIRTWEGVCRFSSEALTSASRSYNPALLDTTQGSFVIWHPNLFSRIIKFSQPAVRNRQHVLCGRPWLKLWLQPAHLKNLNFASHLLAVFGMNTLCFLEYTAATLRALNTEKRSSFSKCMWDLACNAWWKMKIFKLIFLL